MADSAGPEPVEDELGTTLTVDELVLRPWRPDDAPALFAACQDPEIARWVTIPQPYRPADADAFIDGRADDVARRNGGAVRDRRSRDRPAARAP